MAAVGVVAASLERLAVEIRHLQRSEVREVEEAFGSGQKGSSAMPHKRNPVLSENITGLARLIRAQVTPALENVALWHERDISHSSVERVSLPDATIALDFALHRMAGLIEQMVVYPEAMTANLNRLGGLVYSQGVLLALVETGMARERAYERVQAAAMRVWDDPARGPAAFRQALRADPVVDEALPGEALDRLFDPAAYSRHVDTIFARVFARGSGAY
jgi:adenylosuccinate lyase